MKRSILFTLMVLIGASCGQKLDNWNITYPAELEMQVQLFKEHAPSHVRSRELTIVLTGHGLRSKNGLLCAGLSCPKEKTIYLDTTSTHWMFCKTAFTLHELGHYVLDRKHIERTFYHPSNPELLIPESVMTINPLIKEEMIVDNLKLQNYYLNELFNGK